MDVLSKMMMMSLLSFNIFIIMNYDDNSYEEKKETVI